MITNASGSVTSANATLTANYPPSIVTQPVASQTVLEGGNATISVVASGTAPLTYQWWKWLDSNSSWWAIPETDSATYSITNANATHSGTYAVGVNNPYGAVTSTYSALVVQGMVYPASVDSEYAGELTISVTGLPAGGVLRLEKYLDENGNGLIDAGEELFQSLEVTDGVLPAIGGVRNLSVPGDEDGLANGAVQTKVKFLAQTDLNRGIGQWIYRAVRVDTGVELKRSLLTVTQPGLAQAIIGQVTSGGVAVPHAFVGILDGKHWGNFIRGMVTDANGHYSIQAAPGEYVMGVLKHGYFHSMREHNGTELVALGSGANTTRNLVMEPTTRKITGRLTDSQTGLGLAGVLLWVDAEDDDVVARYTYAMTDTDGNYTVRVPAYPYNWELGLGGEDFAMKGYVLTRDHNDTSANEYNVWMKEGNVTMPNLPFLKANALVHGTLTDVNGTVLGGYQLGLEDGPVFLPEANGSYAVGVLGGQEEELEGSDDYFGMRGYFEAADVEFTAVANQAVLADTNATPHTAWLEGRVLDNLGNPVAAMDIEATRYDGGPWIRSVISTDSNGSFRLGIEAGSWQIGIDSSNGFVQDLVPHYLAVGQNVSAGQTISNIAYTAQKATRYLTIQMKDNEDRPVPNVSLYMSSTISNFYHAHNFELDDNGTRRVGVLPGNWILNPYVEDLGDLGYATLSNQNLVVGAGDMNVTFTAQPRFTITGGSSDQWVAADANVTLSVEVNATCDRSVRQRWRTHSASRPCCLS